jgi:hypothetical protein
MMGSAAAKNAAAQAQREAEQEAQIAALQQQQAYQTMPQQAQPMMPPQGQPTGQPAAQETRAQDPIAMLKQLGELKTAGVLTDAEFEAKKAQLLKQI